MTGFDQPFYNIFDQLVALLPFFVTQAWGIAKILIILSLGLAGLKHAINGTGLKDSFSKLAIAFIVMEILIGGDRYDTNYAKITRGMQNIVYSWSYNSLYDKANMQNMIDSKTASIRTLKKKLEFAEENAAYATGLSRLTYGSEVKKLKKKVASAEKVGAEYLIDPDMYNIERGVIQPHAFIQMLGSVFHEIVDQGDYKAVDPIPKILNLITGLVVLACGTLGGLQYYICILEFALITSVAVFLLPCMLWDGTKFMTEKLFGALLGFFLKMLFCTLTILLMIYGFLGMVTPDTPYEGATGQIVTIIFSSIFYMMLCQSGPQLAISLLTGTPQMSLMEGAKAVGAFGAAGLAAAKGGNDVASGAAKAGTSAVLSGSKAIAAGAVGGLGAAAKSVAGDIGQGIKNTAKNGALSLMSGGKAGYNGNSPLQGLLHANADGTQKSFSSRLSAQKEAGAKSGQVSKDNSDRRAEQIAQKKDQKATIAAYKKSPEMRTESDQNKAYDF